MHSVHSSPRCPLQRRWLPAANASFQRPALLSEPPHSILLACTNSTRWRFQQQAERRRGCAGRQSGAGESKRSGQGSTRSALEGCAGEQHRGMKAVRHGGRQGRGGVQGQGRSEEHKRGHVVAAGSVPRARRYPSRLPLTGPQPSQRCFAPPPSPSPLLLLLLTCPSSDPASRRRQRRAPPAPLPPGQARVGHMASGGEGRKVVGEGRGSALRKCGAPRQHHARSSRQHHHHCTAQVFLSLTSSAAAGCAAARTLPVLLGELPARGVRSRLAAAAALEVTSRDTDASRSPPRRGSVAVNSVAAGGGGGGAWWLSVKRK